jgi:hypothetical protein
MEGQWLDGIGMCRVKIHVLAEAVGFENERATASLRYLTESVSGKT